MVTYEINIRTGSKKERTFGPAYASRVKARGRGNDKAEAACLREFTAALKQNPPVTADACAVCFVSYSLGGIGVIAEYLPHRGAWRLEKGIDGAPDRIE